MFIEFAKQKISWNELLDIKNMDCLSVSVLIQVITDKIAQGKFENFIEFNRILMVRKIAMQLLWIHSACKVLFSLLMFGYRFMDFISHAWVYDRRKT